MQTVVAGLVWRKGRVLIAQRNESGAYPMLWEFPGGKVEAGESLEEALTRELREELNIEAIPEAEFTRYEYSYPGKPPILLVFFAVTEFSGEVENGGLFAELRWERPGALARYPFLAGDLTLIQLLGKVEIDQV